MSQKPSVGRIVHIGVNPCAALIIGVSENDRCNLVVWQHDGSQETQLEVPYSAEPSDLAWSWPPRV